jgi:hypothetical protein
MRFIKVMIIVLALVVFTGNCGGMSLVEKYANVKIGDWVSLEITNGTKQFIFIADKNEKTMTIEVEEKDRGYVVAWRQLVIDIAEKKTILVRDKDPINGEVKEHPPTDEESIDEVLQAEFKEVSKEKRNLTIEILNEKTLRYDKVKKTFNCTLFESVLDDHHIDIWYSDEIPLYPVVANIYGINTTIKLKRYGTGATSKFLPEDKTEKTEN